MVASGSTDGLINVYELRDAKLHLMFESENVKLDKSSCTGPGNLICRQIRSLILKNPNIYYGDEGMNIKALNWKKGEVLLGSDSPDLKHVKVAFCFIEPTCA